MSSEAARRSGFSITIAPARNLHGQRRINPAALICMSLPPMSWSIPRRAPHRPFTLLQFPGRIETMADDIRDLRPLCDILVVSLHKGLGFIQAKLAMYEQQASHAAIDAGADLILGHHAHMLRGVEYYRGKPIFHGLGHFVVAKHPRGPRGDAFLGGATVCPKEQGPPRSLHQQDAAYPMHPYHPETMQTMIAKCAIEGRTISRVSYLPCLINRLGQPEILGNDEKGRRVFDYMEKITETAGLNARYEWDGDEVAIHPAR